jgi:hypothetical protein
MRAEIGLDGRLHVYPDTETDKAALWNWRETNGGAQIKNGVVCFDWQPESRDDALQKVLQIVQRYMP